MSPYSRPDDRARFEATGDQKFVDETHRTGKVD